MLFTKRDKLLTALVVFILVGSAVFAFGVAWGISLGGNRNASDSLDILSVAGTWVSSLGGIIAVFATIGLYVHQLRLKEESMNILANAYLLPPTIMKSRLGVSIVNTGERPIHVNGLHIISKLGGQYMFVRHLDPIADNIPKRLDYGESCMLILGEGMERYVKRYVNEHCGGNYQKMMLRVATSIKSHDVHFSHEGIELIKNCVDDIDDD